MPWSVRVWWVGSALVLAGVGWFKSINLLLLLGYVLLALVGVNAWTAWRSARRLTATRRPSAPVFPGEAVVVSVEVTNPSARPVTALVTDRSALEPGGLAPRPARGRGSRGRSRPGGRSRSAAATRSSR